MIARGGPGKLTACNDMKKNEDDIAYFRQSGKAAKTETPIDRALTSVKRVFSKTQAETDSTPLAATQKSVKVTPVDRQSSDSVDVNHIM